MRPPEPRRATPVSWILLLSWIGVHVAALVMSGGAATGGSWVTWGAPRGDVLVRLGAEVEALVRQGEVHRLLTYAFLHAFVLHLLLNGWVWLAIGRFLEDLIGSARLFIVFVVSAIAGGVAHLLLQTGPLVGASGGVFGAVGALGLWSVTSKHPAAGAARRTVLIFLILSVALLFLPNVGHAGHLGGLVAGVLAMALLGPRRSERPAGLATKAAALAMLGLVGFAAWAQGTASSAGERGAFLAELADVERLATRLYERPDLARDEQRTELGRRLDALLAEPWLDDWDGAGAFRAYVGAWRPVADGDVPDPFRFQATLDAARAAWQPFLDRLRIGSRPGGG